MMFNWHVLVIVLIKVLLLIPVYSLCSKDAPLLRRCAINCCPTEYTKLKHALSSVTYRDYLKDCARYNCGIKHKKFFEMKKRRELYGNTCLRLNCVRPTLKHEIAFYNLKRCINRDFKCRTQLMKEMAKRYGDHLMADL